MDLFGKRPGIPHQIVIHEAPLWRVITFILGAVHLNLLWGPKIPESPLKSCKWWMLARGSGQATCRRTIPKMLSPTRRPALNVQPYLTLLSFSILKRPSPSSTNWHWVESLNWADLQKRKSAVSCWWHWPVYESANVAPCLPRARLNKGAFQPRVNMTPPRASSTFLNVGPPPPPAPGRRPSPGLEFWRHPQHLPALHRSSLKIHRFI